MVFGRPTTLTFEHINLHLYYLLAYDLSQIRDTTLKFFQYIEKLAVFLCLFLGTGYTNISPQPEAFILGLSVASIRPICS